MDLGYWLGEKFSSVFRRAGVGGRRAKREGYNIKIDYAAKVEMLVEGVGRILDASTGGLRLELDHTINKGDILAIRVNPYTMFKQMENNQIAKDNRGRYLVKAVWVNPIPQSRGCTAGCAFLRRVKGIKQKDLVSNKNA